jgi:hypothetical protein
MTVPNFARDDALLNEMSDSALGRIRRSADTAGRIPTPPNASCFTELARPAREVMLDGQQEQAR